ncbi:MAG: site-2 protease family protein [Cyanobacteria bacterium J069]|nr:MAG: site-2 protease family protein [Cyanobacteria bacterium J069]
MRAGWRVGSIFGIPLLVDSSWFLILGLFTYSNSLVLQQNPGYPASVAWITGLGLALSLFGSVLLHELGHSLTARSQGIGVNSITLFLFGGIASIDRESKTPGQMFQVAIAGPAVSFALFLLLAGAGQVLPVDTPLHLIATRLSAINLVLALFNLIPGLPLDGGQVLKAAVWKLTGSRIQGMRWAARSGQALGWLGIALAVMAYFQSPSGNFNAIWLGLIAWFILSNARAYSRVSDVQEAVDKLTAADAMTREFRVADADLSLDRFISDYVEREEAYPPAFYAASDGRYRGQVLVEDVQQIERSQWRQQTLQDIAHPLTEIPSVAEASPLSDAIDKLETLSLKRITVLSPAGAVAGVLDRGDIVRAVAKQLKVPVPDALIARIKEDGVYPPGLPLPAIALSLNEDRDHN